MTLIRENRFNDDKWGIDWEEYKELSYFCMQYHKKLKEADALLTLRTSTGGIATDSDGNGVMLPHGSGGVSDPVAVIAAKREKLLKDCRMIEQAALAAGGDMYQWLLKMVTSKGGVQSIAVECPAGDATIWRMRRQFFYVLKRIREDESISALIRDKMES